jgi:predicted DCC family thiol-disulfide oxidoreductase YuxK
MTGSPLSDDLPKVLFDAQCSLCGRCVDWVTERCSDQILFVPANSVDPADFGLTPEDLDSSMWLVWPNGVHVGGSDAALEILKIVGGRWRVLAAVGQVPPLSYICRGVYRLVARNRKRLGLMCGPACQIAGDGTNPEWKST